MSHPELASEDRERLCGYDTPTVCNAIEMFAVRPRTAGYMDSRIKACFPDLPPVVGYAATVTLRTAAPAPVGTSSPTLVDQVKTFGEVPAPPLVVFQDLDEPPAAATFGEVMCATYKSCGAVGIVTGGAGRDLEQVRELGFPAFSNGAICSHGYWHLVDLQVPVHVGGITISPGDLLHADCNGVATIPGDIAADLAQVCAEFVAAEEVVLEYLRGERVTPAGLAAARDECAARIRALSDRVRRRAS